MNYEKAYKDALERAKNIRNSTEFDYEKGMMEEVFPELAENEDERIMKELITHCRNTRCVTEEGAERIAKWIAWLEKQKSVEWSEDSVKKALLSEVLPQFMHGGEADEIVAKLDEVMNNKKNMKSRKQVKRIFPLNQDDWTDEDYEAAISEEVRKGIDRAVNSTEIQELMKKI